MLSGIAVLVVTSAMLVTPVHASTGGWFGGGTFFSNFISFFAQKFGLDKTQVQSAMQDFRAQHKATITPRPTMTPAARQAQEKARLDKLVSQNVITQAQEDAILAELTAVQAKYPVNTSQTPAERQSRQAAIQAELTTWAKANNINPQYVGGFMGRGTDGQGRGPGWGRRGGPRPSGAPTAN